MKGLKGRRLTDILGRKTIITSLVVLIVVLIIATIILALGATQEEETKQIVYKENAVVDYKVFLKENDFFGQEYLGKDKQYIASLIKHVEGNFKYNLSSTEPNLKHKYTYKIVAETNVVNKTNKNTIYKFDEVLLPEKALEFNTNKKLQINESVQIDYNKYNEIIKEFIKVYTLDDITSTLTIKMFVNVDGVSVSKSPVSTLSIPLTSKTMAINIGSNAVNATEHSVYQEIADNNNKYIAILTAILTVLVGIELYMFTRSTKDAEALYRNKIKKLLLNYDSYIQKVNKAFDYEDYQEIEMKTFEDLLQIRDTISQPILMIENEEEKKTNFVIPSKGKVIYTFTLRMEDCIEESEQKQKAKEKIKV